MNGLSLIFTYVFVNQDEENNERDKIIKDISHIHFVNLKKLGLFKNMISSIEGIEKISMPSLQSFDISKNK